ncbi:sensor histidine kinase [Halobacterium litoreum]|uniref:histidine kinase n=1 Tax=Halobacterium litoreum TaxID=2039234 RepID=A0ABD5NEW1_9EURY|nr:ATP-binding protein [Halobacterium litoreum]UHH13467.1 ATP-binding protein [Halobacterium litoreum]
MSSIDPLLAAYVASFTVAAVVCVASVPRARRVDHADTRRGFVALLLTSAGWAIAQVGFLLAPGPEAKTAFHIAGLVVGFSTVGAWLYFCSAYSGRTLHRDPRYRRAAMAVFLAVVAVKVTNPVHHVYFTTSVASAPFPHVVVHNNAVHWVVSGLAYALSAVGYFMLFELFDQTSLDTRPLTGLAALTALPVAFNVVGYATPRLVDMTYEPIGVAAFAVGVLYVFTERFQAIRLAGEVDDPVVFVDENGRIRDYNEKARELFPALYGADGEPLAEVAPAVADAVGDEDEVLEFEDGGRTRYFLVTANPFSVGATRLGRMLLFSDVTRSERHRRELERQNERLGQFASIVSHDLRNPLNVAKGRLEIAREGRDDENLDAVANAHDRMEALIDDVLALARQGETIGDTDACDLRALTEESWETVATPDATLVVADELRFEADADRLRQLFENLFRNSVEHAGEDVTVTVGALDGAGGFYVADDGPGVPEDDRESVFEAGHTTDPDGTGFGLAIVKSIAEAHGWRIRVTDADGGGARFEVRGVAVAEPATAND